MRQQGFFSGLVWTGIVSVFGAVLLCSDVATKESVSGRFLFAYIERMENRPPWNLWSMETDGSGLRRISQEEHSDTEPDWCPTTRQIACLSSRNEQDPFHDIYVMDAEGGNALRLTNEFSQKSSPTWSPDGKQIAYVLSNGRDDINVVDARTKVIRPLLQGGQGGILSVDWSPDGKRLAFAATGAEGQYDIYTVDSNGRNVRQLTQTVGEVTDEQPLWSPEGREILFVRRVGRDTATVQVIDADGNRQRTVTDESVLVNLAMWSPDGQMIAYAAPDHLMHVIDTTGTELHTLPLPLGWISKFQWVDESLKIPATGKLLAAWGWLKGRDGMAK